MAETKKLSIIAFSGDFDKLTAVFTLGTGAAAVGYEVNIFFTFWGLDAIKKKQGRSFTGGNWLTKIFGFMMGGLKVTPTSRFNFLGAGPKIFRYLMKKNNVATLEELVEAAKALGINMYACPFCNSRSSRHTRLHSRGSTRVPNTSRGAPFPPPSSR